MQGGRDGLVGDPMGLFHVLTDRLEQAFFARGLKIQKNILVRKMTAQGTHTASSLPVQRLSFRYRS